MLAILHHRSQAFLIQTTLIFKTVAQSLTLIQVPLLCTLGGQNGPSVIYVSSDKADQSAMGSYQILQNLPANAQ